MSGSTGSNIWIEHSKLGAWMDGPMDSLKFSGMRIRDTTADGINFHGGVTNSTVTNSDIRNTGDDGIATWADASIGVEALGRAVLGPGVDDVGAGGGVVHRLDVERLLAEPTAGVTGLDLVVVGRQNLGELRGPQGIARVVESREVMRVGEQRRRRVGIDDRHRHAPTVGGAGQVVDRKSTRLN